MYVGPTTERGLVSSSRDSNESVCRVAEASTFENDEIRPATSHFVPLEQLRDAAAKAVPGASGDVASMSLAERLSTTMRAGIANAASDTTSEFGAWVAAHPAKAAGYGLAAGAYVGSQAIPGVDVGVDLTLGIVSAATYAFAGPDHRANITRALTHLHDYAKDVAGAQTPDDLERASSDFADFLKIGGKEAIDALGVVSSVASAPTQFFGLAKKIQELGGFQGVLAAGSRLADAVGETSRSARGAVDRGLDEVGAWFRSAHAYGSEEVSD